MDTIRCSLTIKNKKMNLKITSQIPLSTGETATNAIATLTTFPTMNDAGGLDVDCDINTYASSVLRDAGADKIYPVATGTYNKVTMCAIVLTAQQAAAANLPYTIYQVVAALLTSTYGWTVIVEI